MFRVRLVNAKSKTKCKAANVELVFEGAQHCFLKTLYWLSLFGSDGVQRGTFFNARVPSLFLRARASDNFIFKKLSIYVGECALVGAFCSLVSEDWV